MLEDNLSLLQGYLFYLAVPSGAFDLWIAGCLDHSDARFFMVSRVLWNQTPHERSVARHPPCGGELFSCGLLGA